MFGGRTTIDTKNISDTNNLHVISKLPSVATFKKIWNDIPSNKKNEYIEKYFDNNEPVFTKNNVIINFKQLLINEGLYDKYRNYFEGTFKRKQKIFYNAIEKLSEKITSSDINILNKYIKNKNIDGDILQNILPNIIIDSTGRDFSALENSIDNGKMLHYNTSIIWIITSLEKATERNKTRPRVVPNIEDMHLNVYYNMIDVLTGREHLPNLDEFWVIFDSRNETITYKEDHWTNDNTKKLSHPTYDKYIRNPEKAIKIEKTGNGYFKADQKILDDIEKEIGSLKELL
jgi:hypothetical protein